MSDERIVISKPVYYRPWDFSGSIENLIERLKNAQEQYSEWDTIYFEKTYWQSQDGFVWLLSGSRLETDEECNERILREDIHKKTQEEKEKELYFELHKKYGNHS